ncbi:tripartite tricarboxylate transporter TctB family protein [Pseudomonas sp. S75]|uniref:tripartite tricarboxylate transporter TctB family protein n=1 Tax=unclassified Pseudomonas TaxID=196821 RepID=UPI001903167A|nr:MULTISPECIES: tripartite tricarboxylate transporter TctB family protein [unclassified Pseudomonas]MBJ9976028.1 tripartite tricarboxylate transporter TctB family protein [Pseudomonas sp. S30]MBK0153550.1 tripartite tricarboxylate transporter TctB family protein [Pseudomonas sp. S75]
MILQRLFALVLLAVCAALAVMAWPYQAAFSYEPVGPRAYPLLMLGLMSLALLYLAVRPTPIVRKDDEPELDRDTLTKIVACVGLLILFAATFESLGFILSAVLVGVPMARLYGGRWLYSAVVVVAMSLLLYWLFDRVMDVPLPLGLLSVLEN